MKSNMRKPIKTVDLGLYGEKVPVGSHIAYLWETPEQFAEGTAFLEAGLKSGDHLVIFGFEEACGEVCKAMTARGHDLDKLTAEGRISMIHGADDGDTMLGTIGTAFRKAIDSGARMIRLLGNIGWGRPGWPSEKDILAFESKVTSAALSFPCVVVCMYNVASLSGKIILHGAFETHPLTICRNLIRENPHYVPVESFLAEPTA